MFNKISFHIFLDRFFYISKVNELREKDSDHYVRVRELGVKDEEHGLRLVQLERNDDYHIELMEELGDETDIFKYEIVVYKLMKAY